MFWKKHSETERKLMQINEILKKSFSNVKKDTANIFQWLNYFYRKSIEQEQMLKQLQLELSYMPKTRDEIKRILEDHYSIGDIMAKIRELNDKVGELVRKQHVHSESYLPHAAPTEYHVIANIEKRLDMLEQKRMSIKDRIMKKLTRNSRDYIKGVILSYIKKYERISALQLKEIMVDEQKFCSKSSFYRILEEIDQLDDIGVVKYGKEKNYISKVVRRI